MPGNPRWDNRAHGLCQREMFGTEGSEWCRVEGRPQPNEPVKSVRFLPIAAKKNRDQPDCKNRSKDGIRPDHLAGNRYENQFCYAFSKLPLTATPSLFAYCLSN